MGRLFRLAGGWWVWRILIGMGKLITYSSMRPRVSLRFGISLGSRWSEAPMVPPCQRLGVDGDCRFQWERQTRLCPLQCEHAPNSGVVHEQQRSYRRRLWADSSGWLEPGRALSLLPIRQMPSAFHRRA